MNPSEGVGLPQAATPGDDWTQHLSRMIPIVEPEPLTVITWEDTTNIAAWCDRDEIAMFARDGGWECQNVGWVVYEDDDCVVLSARRSADTQRHVGLTERIPKRAILDRREITS